MRIAKRTLTHIGKLNRALAAGIHKPVTALRMEFCSSDNLSQFFHVSRLYINNVEALVLNVEVP